MRSFRIESLLSARRAVGRARPTLTSGWSRRQRDYRPGTIRTVRLEGPGANHEESVALQAQPYHDDVGGPERQKGDGPDQRRADGHEQSRLPTTSEPLRGGAARLSGTRVARRDLHVVGSSPVRDPAPQGDG